MFATFKTSNNDFLLVEVFSKCFDSWIRENFLKGRIKKKKNFSRASFVNAVSNAEPQHRKKQ